MFRTIIAWIFVIRFYKIFILNINIRKPNMELAFKWKGLAGMGVESTSTLSLCSPTARGTNSALKVPGPATATAAGTDAPFGPIRHFRSAHCFALYIYLFLKQSNYIQIYCIMGSSFSL